MASNAHDQYRERTTATLLGRSVAQALHTARQEWRYAGECGHSETDLSCELCGCAQVRYWFEIHNAVNGQRLKIGSECVQAWMQAAPGLDFERVKTDRARLEREVRVQVQGDLLKRAARIDPWLKRRRRDLQAALETHGTLTPKVREVISKVLSANANAGAGASAEAGPDAAT